MNLEKNKNATDPTIEEREEKIIGTELSECLKSLPYRVHTCQKTKKKTTVRAHRRVKSLAKKSFYH